jgi:Fe-S cluster assembly protein SufD
LFDVNERFSPAAAGTLPDRGDRQDAATRAAASPLPGAETEEWRYSLVGDAPLADLGPRLEPPGGPAADPLDEQVPDRAATVTVVDGWLVGVELADGWADKGVRIDRDPAAGWRAGAATGEETIFDLLHLAFSPAAIRIRVPQGLNVPDPVVVIDRHSGGPIAGFPHVVVDAGASSQATVIHHLSSEHPGGLSVPVVELDVGPAAVLRYQQVQELDREHWSLGRHRSSVAEQATLRGACAAFGGHYARIRTDSRLIGRGATGELVAAYYGAGSQVHDFRTFLHHDARDTRSDLLFKGVQDGASGSIYTGLIHIHPGGAGTNAFQTNRNVKLSPDAWAWSVPNLEIENNDVHCSHASTVSPIDPEQQFYLHSRGVPPVLADRLIVEGFFDEVLDRLPAPVLRPRIEELVAAELNERMA